MEAEIIRFKTWKDAETYYKKNVATTHQCTSKCNNDIDCPLPPFEDWVEGDTPTIIIEEAESLQESDFYDLNTHH